MNYELIYILTPKLSEDDAKKQMAVISKSIEKEAGKVVLEDFWGKRELAYPIQKFTDGYYVISQFVAEAEAVAKVEKDLKLTDEVIRHLLIKKDKLAKSKEELRVSSVVAKKGRDNKPVEQPAPAREAKDSSAAKSKVEKKDKTKISDLDDKLDDILEKGLDD